MKYECLLLVYYIYNELYEKPQGFFLRYSVWCKYLTIACVGLWKLKRWSIITHIDQLQDLRPTYLYLPKRQINTNYVEYYLDKSRQGIQSSCCNWQWKTQKLIRIFRHIWKLYQISRISCFLHFQSTFWILHHFYLKNVNALYIILRIDQRCVYFICIP
jgi:hypothetical protein